MPRPSGKRGTFTFRVTASLRERLEAAAEASQRPVSEVIETMLERAFLMDDLSRVARETIRQEMRAEFEARRDLEEQAIAEHQRQVLAALGFKETVN
jgi:hypothetical protein